MRRRIATFSIAAMLASLSADAAPNQALDNILVSRTNGIGKLQIWPGCRMEYLDHSPKDAGIELRVTVRLLDDCDDVLAEVRSESYEPAGQNMANVSVVEFEKRGNGEAFITLRFDEPSSFEVEQVVVGWIEISVNTNLDSRTLPASVPPPVDTAPAVVAVPKPRPRTSVPPASRSTPVRRTSRPSETQSVSASAQGEFAVQLGVFDDPQQAVAALAMTEADYLAYTTEIEVNGRRWYGLQVGFFQSEGDADLALRTLAGVFPDAWVRVVSPEENSYAQSARIDLTADSPTVSAVRVSREAPDASATLASTMEEARQALLRREYAVAAALYTDVLEQPSHAYRERAREYLAVALERSGDHEHAMAEYQAYLAEFPDANGAQRVEARLRSLDTALAVTNAPILTPTRTARSDGWQIHGGVSQVYWRNEDQLVHDGNYLVSSSGVLALADIAAMKSGDRYDVVLRANGAYQFNLVDFDDDGDTGWLSLGYADITDRTLGIGATVGRQTRRQDGVLDRFDGLGIEYQWKPDVAFSVSAGLPIDSPRFVSETHRSFYAASIRLDEFLGLTRLTLYNQHQFADGILDRQAIGGELQYLKDDLSVVGLVDFDVSYSVLNTALVNAAYNLDNGWRLNGVVRAGAQPYLTTRNALAGQSVTSIDELLTTYSEGQIRRIARDRTAQALTASAGVSIPLTDRLQLDLDVTARQSDGTEASAGVAALPDTGSQMFYLGRLTASGLLTDGDLSILTLRHDATRTRDTSTVMLDMRLPLTEGLRINPRLIVSARTDNTHDMQQLLAKPSLRVLYRWKRLTLDVELGGYWSDRELPATELDPFTVDGTEELTGGFINAGYRWEF